MSTPSETANVPVIDVAGLPGTATPHVKPPSPLIERVTFAFWGASAAQSPVSLAESNGCGCGVAGGVDDPGLAGWSFARSWAESVSFG